MVSGPEWRPRPAGESSAHGVRRDGENSPPDHGSSDRRFRPEHRLRRRRDFERVLSGGVRLNAQVVTIVLRPNGADHSRLGVAVSRRVARRAVARHHLKRQIRESFRHNAARLKGLDVVVIANSGAHAMDSKGLRRVLARAWERADRRIHRESVPASETRDA